MTTNGPAGRTPAGWYPVPDGRTRYWDGSQWTENFAGGQAAPKGKRPLHKRWWFWLLMMPVGLILLLILLALLAALFGGETGPTEAPPKKRAAYDPVRAREFKLIEKDPDAHEGERIVIYGVVTQFDSATGESEFRADTGAKLSRDAFGYSVNSLVSVADSEMTDDLVSDDHVKMYVEVMGSYSYETQIGGETTVPRFNLGIVEVVDGRK